LAHPQITLATYRYEHTEALFDGRVGVGGVHLQLETAGLVSEIFFRMTRGDFDVAEYGLTYFLRTFDAEDPPFLALPIFPNRNFRHSAIYINPRSGIERPEDLTGKRIGEFALYGHDAGVWPKGILSDEHGFKPDQCSWVIGGTDHPIPAFSWIPQPVPAGVDVQHAEDGQTLGAMLTAGELDALISVDVPQALLRGEPGIARLFPDHEAVERDYYRRTGIFPPMHIVAVRRELASEPGLVEAVYTAFSEAKDLALQRYRADAAKQHMSMVTPWLSPLVAENRRLLGEDWWPYGVSANRSAVDTFLRYHHEQGLSSRRLRCEDIFVPGLMHT